VVYGTLTIKYKDDNGYWNEKWMQIFWKWLFNININQGTQFHTKLDVLMPWNMGQCTSLNASWLKVCKLCNKFSSKSVMVHFHITLMLLKTYPVWEVLPSNPPTTEALTRVATLATVLSRVPYPWLHWCNKPRWYCILSRTALEVKYGFHTFYEVSFFLAFSHLDGTVYNTSNNNNNNNNNNRDLYSAVSGIIPL
jgi:hypothetical protein